MKDSVVKKYITVGDTEVKVIKKGISNSKLVESGIISYNDAEMDRRASAAVSIAIRQAKICNKPIAKYDGKEKRPYFDNMPKENL